MNLEKGMFMILEIIENKSVDPFVTDLILASFGGFAGSFVRR
jgi:hypothetical protein